MDLYTIASELIGTPQTITGQVIVAVFAFVLAMSLFWGFYFIITRK